MVSNPRTVAAPLLSGRCAICVVPGIGKIHGFCAINQASVICAGEACDVLAHSAGLSRQHIFEGASFLLNQKPV